MSLDKGETKYEKCDTSGVFLTIISLINGDFIEGPTNEDASISTQIIVA